ncbi:MAG: ATP-binding protein [Acidimicrobiales bacterium]
MSEVVELEIPARPEFVALARLVVSAMAATDASLSDDQVDDLKIAVSEACTNAIEAHSAVETEVGVRVKCWSDDRGLRVSIEDRGPGFDPSTLPLHPPPTDPDRLKFERGLGLPLIRALVDDVEISSSGEGTEVRLAMWHVTNGRR